MNIILFWKTLTELSLYFSFAHFVGAIAGATEPLLRSVLLLALTGTLGRAIDRKGHPRLKYLALALMVPVFWLTGNLVDKLLLIIPAAYVVLMIHRNAGDTSYYEYQRQYMFGVKLLCVIGVLLLMAWQHPVVADYVLPYVLCYLAGGVLALRLLRHSDEMLGSRSLWLHNVISILGLAGVGLLLTSEAAGKAALGFMKMLFDFIVYPLTCLLTWIMSHVMYLILLAVSKIEFGEQEGGLQMLAETAEDMTEKMMEQGEINTLPTEVIMGAILVLIFGALAFMMVKFLKKSSAQRQNTIHEVRSRLDDAVRDHRDSAFDRGPRGKVRATYRKFINLCIGAGAKISRADTTEDIERQAQYALLKPPMTKELQAVYRRARYSAEEITEADVAEAKQAYQAAKAHYKKVSKV